MTRTETTVCLLQKEVKCSTAARIVHAFGQGLQSVIAVVHVDEICSSVNLISIKWRENLWAPAVSMRKEKKNAATQS